MTRKDRSRAAATVPASQHSPDDRHATRKVRQFGVLGPQPRPCPWAARILSAGHAAGKVPPYRSPAWHRLADDDPCKLAAVVLYAECWHAERQPDVIADRLRREVEVAAHVELQLDFLEPGPLAESVDEERAQRMRSLAERPTYDELQGRRSA